MCTKRAGPTATSSGDFTVQTVNAGVSGVSGKLAFSSGSTSKGASGKITMATGAAKFGSTGEFALSTGTSVGGSGGSVEPQSGGDVYRRL